MKAGKPRSREIFDPDESDSRNAINTLAKIRAAREAKAKAKPHK